MNWGLYNDTYGDPWAITYAGQFWTEIDIGAYGPLQLSQRDASVSPEPPATPRLLDKQWILAPQALSDIRTTFQFMGNLCAEFGGGEAVQWSLEASKLNGKWISFGRQASAMGPSKAPSIRRDGDMPADGFTSDWSDVYIDFAKDLCDAFCRDGRVVTREALAALCEAAGT